VNIIADKTKDAAWQSQFPLRNHGSDNETGQTWQEVSARPLPHRAGDGIVVFEVGGPFRRLLDSFTRSAMPTVPPASNATPGSSGNPEAENLPRCPCGHDRTHFLVSPEGKYTLIGWFWVTLMGVTTKPVRIDYRCRKCGNVLETTTDPKVLSAHA